MKPLLIISTLATLLVACGQNDAASGAGTSTTNANALADTANYTSIQWLDSTYQDLGKVKKGQVVEIAWRFKNTGNKPLVIQSVRPGCGCTVADKPEAPLAPGAEGTIKGKFDSNNQSAGEHRKVISVDANTSGSAYHQLNFRVEVME
ncbi:Protein of unknown function [Cnuella takakiae]|uniref:DUF1573 domain-containing protein n=1 Tax=Cnuella takakiae TaxID=1302690 RepID=A0A1M4Y361_9BACT|nr:DUF1573 domain-containing protein [Cnuella takakiae]OLY93030.1 hypothetical protein BUE76_14840 [Cnuella takakiae]SHF00016.1 Protein of unknown function [Cnuella takakiae]